MNYLKDEYEGTTISLCENIILMAFGSIKNSFITLFAAKKVYTIEDYLN